MGKTRAQAYTEHFYGWERKGRGWDLFAEPVEIEPPFEHFRRSALETDRVDDGLVPSIWSRIFSLFKRKPEGPKRQSGQQAFPLGEMPPLTAIKMIVGKSQSVTAAEAERLLLALAACRHPVSFEILGTADTIALQLVCAKEDAHTARQHLKGYFPEVILEAGCPLRLFESGHPSAAFDMGLEQEFMRPLEMEGDLSLDPMQAIFSTVDGLGEGERALLQVTFRGCQGPWAESMVAAVTDGAGKSFFMDAPDMPKLAKEKVSAPLFAATVRVAAQGKTKLRASEIAAEICTVLSMVARSPCNSLVRLPNGNYPDELHLEDIENRRSRRLGMILNSLELSGLAHLPSSSVNCEKLERTYKKTNAAPAGISGGVAIGDNLHKGREARVTLGTEQRLRHMHVIGATGTGKSNLMLNLVGQDMAAGRGLAVLDPHGDLIETVLSAVPLHRHNDVVLVDPSDTEFPVGFNILSARTEIEKEILSSDLVSTFRRFSTSWGDQMNSVLANAILAFVESEEGGTLLDLRRFLVEKEFRERHLQGVSDQAVLYYWLKEYPLIKGASIGPILTRLDTFLRPKIVRNMVGQKRSLDFGEILDGGKILLIKLPQGLIGEDNSYLLGTLFISKLYQAAMARQSRQANDRREFYCYIDEFQNFITPSMGSILSGARKYGFGLVMAHQDMQQLAKNDAEIANAVLSNSATRVCFRVGDADAKKLEDGFAHFDANDLQNLARGEAIGRIEKAEHDFNLSVPKYRAAEAADAEAIIAASRKKHSCEREKVEASFGYFENVKDLSVAEPIAKPISKQGQKEIPVEEQPVLPVVLEIKEKPEPEILPKAEEARKVKEELVRRKQETKHRYLQNLVKKVAESNGFKASVEEPTNDRKGRVDVCLEKSGKRTACEIGVTTTKEWEAHNIEKCLADGYEKVIAIADSAAAKRAMLAAIDESPIKGNKKILVMEMDELFSVLSEEGRAKSEETKTIKGYRVKVKYES